MEAKRTVLNVVCLEAIIGEQNEPIYSRLHGAIFPYVSNDDADTVHTVNTQPTYLDFSCVHGSSGMDIATTVELLSSPKI